MSRATAVKAGSSAWTVSAGHRRLTWALALAQLLSWGAFYYALPIFVAPISEELGWSRQSIFWGLSGALLTSVFVAPLAGRQIDRGRGKAVLVGGQLIGSMCLAALAAVDSLWLFLLLCGGIGVSQGACLYDTAFSLLHRHLKADAPGAIIRVTLIAGLAGTVFVPAGQYLVEHLGWRAAAPILAAAGLIPIALYAPFLPGVGRDTDFGDRSGSAPLPPLPRNGAIIAIIVAFGASTAVFSTVTIHFLPLMIDRGLSGLAAAQIFALIGPAQILGRVAIWLLPIRVGALDHGVTVFLLQALAVLVLALAGTGAWLVLFALVFGLSSGLLTIVRGAAPAELCDYRAIGRLNGLIGAVSGLTRALVPALFALAIAYVGVGTALAILLAISLAGAAAFISARLIGRQV